MAVAETAPIEDAMVTLTIKVRELQEENARLRAHDTERWQLSARAQKAEDESREAKRRLEKLEHEYATAHRDRVHWRNAVRYEQSLKRHTANPRHLPLALPTYNSVRRSRYVATGPFAGVPNCERVFLKHWRKENKRVRGLNGGRGLLELLLSEDINGVERQLTQR